MHAKKGSDGLRSAYDLAMARFGDEGPPLSSEQKAELAEAERKVQARIAEIKIMADQRIVAARAAGDGAKLAELQQQRAGDIEKAQRKGEAQKQRIRDEAQD